MSGHSTNVGEGHISPGPSLATLHSVPIALQEK